MYISSRGAWTKGGRKTGNRLKIENPSATALDGPQIIGLPKGGGRPRGGSNWENLGFLTKP